MSMWAGDQNVDWSTGDGLPSVIPAALSLGMTGISRVHFDIGGYTTFVGQIPVLGNKVDVNMVRTKELFLRSAELAVFTPIMRTHEGNIPEANYQVYNDEDGLKQFAVLVNMFRALAPYTRFLLDETTKTGLPLQRPLFLHYEGDKHTFDIPYQYMYGRHLLVAPVLEPNVTEKDVYLPGSDYWVHMFSGEQFAGGQTVRVAAPLGQPPVFYPKASGFVRVFEELARIALGLEEEAEDDRIHNEL